MICGFMTCLEQISPLSHCFIWMPFRGTRGFAGTWMWCWTMRPASEAADAPEPGRPGVIDGRRDVIQADGRLVAHPANLGESPIAWLARRKDASGRP